MTAREEALRALEKKLRNASRFSRSTIFTSPLRAQAEAFKSAANELAAILATASEQAPVADAVEGFLDDLVSKGIATEHSLESFDPSHAWKGVDSVLVSAFACGENGLKFDMIQARRLIHEASSPAHTSEARDAAARNLLSVLDQHMYPNDYCGYEVGKRDADTVNTAIEALRAAMRQEAGDAD